jgi:4-hydroxythreonine-4-phosphate dehydrogenase
MLLTSSKLRISHATTHVALRDVPSKLTSERILRVIELTDDFLKKIRIERPKIGVLALNPHAGEHGLFGMEEEQVIAPAISEAEKNGMQVFGPLPADSAVYYAIQGKYDALVAMYHDQGHIPIKLLGFYQGVNVTLGLPIIRTSVDHGTAFDIVGQNIANPSSLIAAIKLAADLTSSKEIQ